MRILGVTGGIGSGKSEVLRYLKTACGAAVSPLDEVARHLQKRGQHCHDRIVGAFGIQILGADGELDRERLAETVFSNPQKLSLLNGIVHPEVKQWVRQDIFQKEREGTGLYVVESALFPDVDYQDLCGEMWYIYADEAVRRQRLRTSRGYTEEKIQRMFRSQPSLFGKEAAQYIENYFDTYPGVKRFLDEQVSHAKKNGYAVTLFGRRRPVPELKSGNFMQRSFGERVAMNAPIQGTAADVIKIAMLGVARELKERGMKSRLILQVHDELLIEAWQEEAGQVKEILKRQIYHISPQRS